MSDNYDSYPPSQFRAPDTASSLEPAYSTQDLEADQDDELFGIGEVATPAPAVGPAAPATASAPRPSKKSGLDRATVKRIIDKYEELAGANTEHLELLSIALGVQNTPADLTAAVIVGGRTSLTGLTDTLALAVADDAFEAIVAAISLGRVRIRGVWAVLAEMGLVSGAIPAADIKAGGAIAKAVASLAETNKTEIAAVLALAKK